MCGFLSIGISRETGRNKKKYTPKILAVFRSSPRSAHLHSAPSPSFVLQGLGIKGIPKKIFGIPRFGLKTFYHCLVLCCYTYNTETIWTALG